MRIRSLSLLILLSLIVVLLPATALASPQGPHNTSRTGAAKPLRLTPTGWESAVMDLLSQPVAEPQAGSGAIITVTTFNPAIADNGQCSLIEAIVNANNGGPSAAHTLLGGSPAIDAGDNATCAAVPVSGVDQRGVLRPQGLVCDIGAFEVEQPPAAVTLADVQEQPSASAPPTSVLWALAIMAILWGVGVGYCLRTGSASKFWSDKSQNAGSNRSISPGASKVNLDGVGSIRRWA